MVATLRDEVDPMIPVMEVQEAPFQSHAHIGALDAQIQEIEETVQLPLTHPQLYENIGIRPPIYGEPGTGKILLAKAVPNSTSATFLHAIGSKSKSTSM